MLKNRRLIWCDGLTFSAGQLGGKGLETPLLCERWLIDNLDQRLQSLVPHLDPEDWLLTGFWITARVV